MIADSEELKNKNDFGTVLLKRFVHANALTANIECTHTVIHMHVSVIITLLGQFLPFSTRAMFQDSTQYTLIYIL